MPHIEQEDLERRLSDLFGHRSLASAIFGSAEDLAEALLSSAVVGPGQGDDEYDSGDFDDGDGDGDDEIQGVSLASLESPSAETVRGVSLAVVHNAIERKQYDVMSDARYAQVGSDFIRDLAASIDTARNEADLSRNFETSRGWTQFVDYMREKMPMNGFGEMMRNHLESVGIQAVASKNSSALLSNRPTSSQTIAQGVMMHLARLTADGMYQEAAELSDQIAGIYLGLLRESNSN